MKDKYREHIKSRSLIKFIIGLLPRAAKWFIFEIARMVARHRGAVVGQNSVMSLHLARCVANNNLVIGANSSIGIDKLDSRSPIIIGNNVIISNDSEIITTSHYLDSPEWEHRYYGIEIEDYVWIASNALILPSCRKIGYGAVIGAGAVVIKDVEPMSIVGGNPARHIRYRKVVHSDLVVPSLLSADLKLYWSIWINRKG